MWLLGHDSRGTTAVEDCLRVTVSWLMERKVSLLSRKVDEWLGRSDCEHLVRSRGLCTRGLLDRKIPLLIREVGPRLAIDVPSCRRCGEGYVREAAWRQSEVAGVSDRY